MAKALIVYHSLFGNTEKIANALATGLQNGGCNAETVNVSAVNFSSLNDVDLLCVGTPVHAFNISKPVKEFLEQLMNQKGLSGKKAFAFDTKMKSRLAGTAGGKIEKKLKELGIEIVKPAKSAVVKGREGPLEEGAEETFKQIGVELAKMM
ncbi:MAG: flavodoxin family protein [Candidatus Thorarchaeota archaeon]